MGGEDNLLRIEKALVLGFAEEELTIWRTFVDDVETRGD